MEDFNSENYVNDESIEMAWAIRAAEEASIYMNLIMGTDTTKLRLNKHQDQIYKRFREIFPNFDVFHVDENALKCDNKDKWKSFCEEFTHIQDFNAGTIMRINADDIYSDSNTVFTVKIIFLAIEAARNIEGVILESILTEFYSFR